MKNPFKKKKPINSNDLMMQTLSMMQNRPKYTDEDLRLRCIELAIQLNEKPIISKAEELFNYIRHEKYI